MNTNRKTFVSETIAASPDISASELSKAVREKFGKGLNIMHARSLLAAGAGFERLWDELFADEEIAQESEAGLKRSKKDRGDRRRKLALKGRREIDRDRILLREFNSHLVVYRANDGFLRSTGLESRNRAEDLIKQLVKDGVAESDIAYFCRDELPLPKAA